MSRSHTAALNAVALACAFVLSGSAIAQDHSGHAMPPTSAHDHSQHEVAKPTATKKGIKPSNTADQPAMDHAAMGHAAPAAKPTPRAKPVDHSTMDHSKMDHGAMDHSKMDQGAMDHSKMDHGAMDHSKMDQGAMDHSKMDHGAMDHSTMGDAKPAAQAPITPIPELTEADRAAAFPVLTQHMEHAPEINHYLAFNRLEAWDASPGAGQAWEATGWIGSDLNRLWVRSEGERVGGTTESADLELLYGRSITPWWDFVAGIKHDFQPGDSQNWAAIGFQGLAPYKFEVQATAYVSESGQTAATLEVEYELLFTNRLILQPLVEVRLFGKDDPARATGSGLSTIETGVRLRYEIRRKFAPYIGLVHERAFGNTAGFRQARNEDTQDTRLVAGVRIWF